MASNVVCHCRATVRAFASACRTRNSALTVETNADGSTGAVR
ncbi:MAG: hypothetical protein SXV54_12715 [Chloroflexota bacterium]|nr:hypothetical protein [Chloroflexota bacterium]